MWGIITEEITIENMDFDMYSKADNEVEAILTRYNGWNDSAQQYGECVKKVYDLFVKINQMEKNV